MSTATLTVVFVAQMLGAVIGSWLAGTVRHRLMELSPMGADAGHAVLVAMLTPTFPLFAVAMCLAGARAGGAPAAGQPPRLVGGRGRHPRRRPADHVPALPGLAAGRPVRRERGDRQRGRKRLRLRPARRACSAAWRSCGRPGLRAARRSTQEGPAEAAPPDVDVEIGRQRRSPRRHLGSTDVDAPRPGNPSLSSMRHSGPCIRCNPCSSPPPDRGGARYRRSMGRVRNDS